MKERYRNHVIKYDHKFCEMLIEHQKSGLTFASFAPVAGVTKKTLYNWVDEYPEFKEAKEIASSHALLAMEKIGLGLATGKLKGAPAVYIHRICNMFPDLYRQRVDIDHTSGGEKISNIPVVLVGSDTTTADS